MSRDRRRHRARIVEAAALLMVARVLVRSVRFGVWRRWLGRVGGDAHPPASPSDTAIADRVTHAVRDACRRRSYHCLPRAMATQWMLRRRGVPSSLMFGVASRPDEAAERGLHAWVQVGSRTVIGADPSRSYHLALTLAQADATR